MISSRHDAVEAQLVQKAGDDLVNVHQGAWREAKAALDALYRDSSMSVSQRDAIAARIDRAEADRPRPF